MKNIQFLLILVCFCFAQMAFGQKSKTAKVNTNLSQVNIPTAPIFPDEIISEVKNFRIVTVYGVNIVYYSYVVKNDGASSSKTSTLQGFWSADDKLDADDYACGGISVTPNATGQFTMDVPNSEIYTEFKGWTLAQMLKAYPYLILVVDFEKEVIESNEENNVYVIRHGL
jgi:hypothetical protein